MDYFNRDLIEATLDQVTKSQHEVLGWERWVISSWVHMKRAADFQSAIKSDMLKACNTATNSIEHIMPAASQL